MPRLAPSGQYTAGTYGTGILAGGWPMDEMSTAQLQSALKNLGMWQGQITGQADDSLREAAGRFMIGFGFGDPATIGWQWTDDMWDSLLYTNHFIANDIPAPANVVSVMTDIQRYPGLGGPLVRVPRSQPAPAPGAPGVTAPPGSGGVPPPVTNDGFGSLMPPDEAMETDSWAGLNALLTYYGIGRGSPYDLSDWIIEQIQGGSSEETIAQLMYTTPQWRARFAGNELVRQQAEASGNPFPTVLSPSEYVDYEHTSASLEQYYGLPPGTLTDPANIARHIGNSVSADELERRVVDAWAYVDALGPETMGVFEELLGANGRDAVATAVLDPDRSWPELERQVQIAAVTGAGLQSGFDIGTGMGGTLVERGVTREQAQDVYAQANSQRSLLDESLSETGNDQTEETLMRAGFDLDQGQSQAALAGRRQSRQAALAGGGGVLGSITEGAVGARRGV